MSKIGRKSPKKTNEKKGLQKPTPQAQPHAVVAAKREAAANKRAATEKLERAKRNIKRGPVAAAQSIASDQSEIVLREGTNLPPAVRQLIVTSLAYGDSREAIVEAVQELYGYRITPQTVSNHNPRTARGQQMPVELKELYAHCQQARYHNVQLYGIAKTEVRHIELDSHYWEAREEHNRSDALKILAYMLKEVSTLQATAPPLSGQGFGSAVSESAPQNHPSLDPKKMTEQDLEIALGLIRRNQRPAVENALPEPDGNDNDLCNSQSVPVHDEEAGRS